MIHAATRRSPSLRVPPAAAVKTKQVVDVAACDALDHAIEDVGKMYTPK